MNFTFKHRIHTLSAPDRWKSAKEEAEQFMDSLPPNAEVISSCLGSPTSSIWHVTVRTHEVGR